MSQTEQGGLQQRIAALEEEVERYRSVMDNAHDLIHSVSPDGAFLFVNRAWRQTLGYGEEDLPKLRLMDIVDESCRDKCRCIFNDLIKGEKLDRNETVFVAKDGRRIVVEGRCSTFFQGGRAVAMTGIFRDITERARSEQALRESEQRFRDLFENATDLIQMVRPDGRLLYVNRAWRETFGYSEEDIAAGLSIFQLISPDCQSHCEDTFKRVISEEKIHQINTNFVAKDGRRIIIEGNAICKFQDGTPISTQCIFRDVTEKKKMEEELLKNQKLESVGVFAGGIAHDFNNLLTAILGNISLGKLYLNHEDRVYKRLEEAEKASLQAKNLTQQLLTFSKGGAPIKKTTTIPELIRDSASFALRGSNVRCQYVLDDNLWPIEVDAGQISQVIQNLVLNAAQAMPAGGTVSIEGGNVISSGHELPGMPPGKYVRIAVTDHGHGIPAENLARIFDPYFTSKETGNGLGLAIAYSIIKKHDGHIAVESVENQGTTFTIHLPATDACPHCPEERQAPLVASKGRLLVMDDDEMIREAAAEMLAYFGFEVEAVSDGGEAVARYREAMEQRRPFAAVVMDLTVPGGMGGKEAMEKLLVIDPGVRAVVSSGYANDPIMANFREYGFWGVVPKPYRAEEMSRVLATVLAEENGKK
ncbi:MAG: PAS domain-containing hybrid sensor histidine kinase/response regulator [Thermodesulfobacteriota bacterium]